MYRGGILVLAESGLVGRSWCVCCSLYVLCARVMFRHVLREYKRISAEARRDLAVGGMCAATCQFVRVLTGDRPCTAGRGVVWPKGVANDKEGQKESIRVLRIRIEKRFAFSETTVYKTGYFRSEILHMYRLT